MFTREGAEELPLGTEMDSNLSFSITNHLIFQP
jgi:hypothetical protein